MHIQCIMGRDEEYVEKKVVRTDVEGRRRKGRPKRRWMDSVNVDLREKELSGETQNTAAWRQLVRNVDPTEK